MNKRWLFTHLLPILLAILLVGGGVVYTVPSWRDKATQIASKTVGILADVVTPGDQPTSTPSAPSLPSSCTVPPNRPEVVGYLGALQQMGPILSKPPTLEEVKAKYPAEIAGLPVRVEIKTEGRSYPTSISRPEVFYNKQTYLALSEEDRNVATVTEQSVTLYFAEAVGWHGPPEYYKYDYLGAYINKVGDYKTESYAGLQVVQGERRKQIGIPSGFFTNSPSFLWSGTWESESGTTNPYSLSTDSDQRVTYITQSRVFYNGPVYASWMRLPPDDKGDLNKPLVSKEPMVIDSTSGKATGLIGIKVRDEQPIKQGDDLTGNDLRGRDIVPNVPIKVKTSQGKLFDPDTSPLQEYPNDGQGNYTIDYSSDDKLLAWRGGFSQAAVPLLLVAEEPGTVTITATIEDPCGPITLEPLTLEVVEEKLPTPALDLVDIQRKNDQEKYVSIPQDHFQEQTENPTEKKVGEETIRNYPKLEIYPDDKIILTETAQNSDQSLKDAKLVLTLPKIKDVGVKEIIEQDGQTSEIDVKIAKNEQDPDKLQDVVWEFPELKLDELISKKIIITLPKNIDIDIKSFKLTPKFKTAHDLKTQLGVALEQNLWDWLEGKVTGPYGNPVPNAYITLVDKDNKDIEHTYYKEELTKTTLEKLKELGEINKSPHSNFNLTDDGGTYRIEDKDGDYKIKVNRKKDILPNDEIKIALYFRDHQDRWRVKTLIKLTKPFSVEGSETPSEPAKLVSKPVKFSWVKNAKKLDISQSKTDDFWRYPVESISLEATKVGAEIYYNLFNAFKIADREWDINFIRYPLTVILAPYGEYREMIYGEQRVYYVSYFRPGSPHKIVTIGSSNYGELTLLPKRLPMAEYHEFGHYLMDVWYNVNGGEFPFLNQSLSNQDEFIKYKYNEKIPSNQIHGLHCGMLNDSTVNSFAEGFADYISHRLYQISDNRPLDTLYSYTTGELIFNFNPPQLISIFNNAQLEEFTVARVLYFIAQREKGDRQVLLALVGENDTFDNNRVVDTLSELYLSLKNILPANDERLKDLFLQFKIYRGGDKKTYNPQDPEQEIGRAANMAPWTSQFTCTTEKGEIQTVGPRGWRRMPPKLPGHYVLTNFYGRAGKIENRTKVRSEIKYDPPVEGSYNYDFVTYPASGETIYLNLEPIEAPSKVYITAEGDPNPLVIDSNDYWQMINSGMFDYIAEHDFYVDGGKPVGVSSEVQPPTGDPAGPASDQQPSFNNLPENMKPAVSTEEQKNLETQEQIVDQHPASTIEGVLDAVIPDPVFNVITNIASTIIDDVNLVIDTITGPGEGKKDELNINELIPQLSLCAIAGTNGTNGSTNDTNNINNETMEQGNNDCRSDFTTLHQGDKLKVGYSFANIFEQTLSGLNLTLQLNYAKPNLYNLDPKNGFKTDSFDQTTQKGQTTINWPIDELKPQEVFSKEIELEITEDQEDNLNLAALISKDDLKRLGETRSIPVSKKPTEEQKNIETEKQGELAPGTEAGQATNIAETAQPTEETKPTLQVITDSIYNFVIQTIPQATQDTYDTIKNYLGNLSPVELWQGFQELFSPKPPDQSSMETIQPFNHLTMLPSALAASTPTIVAGPTISLSKQTPSPIKAPTTLIIDVKGFDKSKKITVYLDNKEYKSTPIISKNFGIRVEIPQNINLGTHTLRVTGDNGQEASIKFKVKENSWWNKRTVGMGLSVLIVLVVVIVAVVIIRRRKSIREETKTRFLYETN